MSNKPKPAEFTQAQTPRDAIKEFVEAWQNKEWLRLTLATQRMDIAKQTVLKVAGLLGSPSPERHEVLSVTQHNGGTSRVPTFADVTVRFWWADKETDSEIDTHSTKVRIRCVCEGVNEKNEIVPMTVAQGGGWGVNMASMREVV